MHLPRLLAGAFVALVMARAPLPALASLPPACGLHGPVTPGDSIGAYSEISPAEIEAKVRDAVARRDIIGLAGLTDEAASLPPGSGSKVLQVLGAAGDLQSGRLSFAFRRLERLGPVALLVFGVVVLGSGLVLSTLIYLPSAMLAAAAGARRIAIELPPERTAAEIENVVRVAPGIPIEWRSPLGLRAGFLLCVADDVFGFAAAILCAWLLRAPAEALAFDVVSRAGALAALAGTGAGNLGALGLALLLYRWRGVGLRGAGLVPLPVAQTAALAAATALPLLVLSMLHELAFYQLIGREPQSNVVPILKALLEPSPSPLVLLGLILVVAVIAPAAEEITYRGVLYRAFRERAGVPAALVLSGFVFSVAHLEMDHLLPLWMIGVALAWLTERTGSLIPAIAAHGLYNGLSLGLYFLTRSP